MPKSASKAPKLSLTVGLDRSLAWKKGGSVRYLVADLAATGTTARKNETPPVNLALTIDTSGSMAGQKLVAARETAAAVARALTSKDRLTIVSFSDEATLLLDARSMDDEGRREAVNAIDRLEVTGSTNLWEGWLLAGERVAKVMREDDRFSHRILLLSDGQANVGLIEPRELARHTAELLARGIITSAVGIGDDYDEALLGAMAEAGGGRLHDAEHATEISEVVLGELREGRATLLDRTTLRVELPPDVRVEVVGAWAQNTAPGAIDVMVGSLLPDTPKRVVLRVHCPAGEPGTKLSFSVSAKGMLPDGSGDVGAGPLEAELTFAPGRENTGQPREIDRSVAVLTAWQAEAMRRTVALNREGDLRGARSFLSRELGWLEPYARDLPGADSLLAELVLLERRAEEELDPRTRKELFMASTTRMRYEGDLRSAPRASVAEVLRRKAPK